MFSRAEEVSLVTSARVRDNLPLYNEIILITVITAHSSGIN